MSPKGSQYASCCSVIQDRSRWGLRRQLRSKHYLWTTGYSYSRGQDIVEYSSACPNATYMIYKPNITSNSVLKSWTILNPAISPPPRTILNCEVTVNDCSSLWQVWQSESSARDALLLRASGNDSSSIILAKNENEKPFVDFPLCNLEPGEPCVPEKCEVWASHVNLYFQAVTTARDMCAISRQPMAFSSMNGFSMSKPVSCSDDASS
jgi:hypothetical protein